MGDRGVEQGLKLPFENSCFDFLIAFTILLEWIEMEVMRP